MDRFSPPATKLTSKDVMLKAPPHTHRILTLSMHLPELKVLNNLENIRAPKAPQKVNAPNCPAPPPPALKPKPFCYYFPSPPPPPPPHSHHQKKELRPRQPPKIPDLNALAEALVKRGPQGGWPFWSVVLRIRAYSPSKNQSFASLFSGSHASSSKPLSHMAPQVRLA